MANLLKVSTVNYPHLAEDNLRYRVKLLKECEKDPVLRAEVKEMCRRDILFWVNVFCWTKDPRKKTDIMPFVAYDAYQNKFILDIERTIDEQADTLIEKSRDMGASWMTLYVFMHKWLFERGSNFRLGSRKEEFVDRPGDIDTLFEKCRFNLQRQPKWLMPDKFDWQKHATYMKLINPELENVMIGESANDSFGSGGRSKAVLLDEYAKWEPKTAEAAWTATADVTNCRIPLSTPLGSGNKFAVLAKGTQEKIAKLTLHWTLHPEKAKGAYYIDGDTKLPIKDGIRRAFELWQSGVKVRSPWYDVECERRSEADIAQELDIDYLRSGHPFFSLKALKKQAIWEYCQRKSPLDPIPAGRHILVKLVKVDYKIEMRESIDGWLRVYELPNPNLQYVIGADTAEGLAKGDECFGVVRCKYTRNVVADFNALIPPEDFAEKLFLVHKLYNDCIVVPENNNHGYTTARDLELLGANLYYTIKEETAQGVQQTKKRGYTTSGNTTRPMFLDQAEKEVRHVSCEIRSAVILAQMQTFIKNPRKHGRPEADGSYHDDGVIAFAICGQVITEQPFKAKTIDDGSRKAKIEELKKKRRNAGIGFGGR